MSRQSRSHSVSPSVRVVILLTALLVGGAVAYYATGSVLPQDPQSSLIFQNGLLLVVLGSSLIETYYTKPADSLVNSLTGVVTLVGVKTVAPALSWWFVLGLCGMVFALSVACVFASSHKDITGWRQALARATYKPAVVLGSSRVIFSVLFLFGVFSFYSLQSPQTVSFIVFWGLFLAIWPLGLPDLLSGLQKDRREAVRVGRIARTDWPGLVRVRIEGETKWQASAPKVTLQADGQPRVLVPLYVATQGEQLIGTGLCVAEAASQTRGLQVGCVYDTLALSSYTEAQIAEALGGPDSSRLVGFVVEGSEVAQIRFQTWSEVAEQGLLVWCRVGSAPVYYQITNGHTHEEAFQSNREGFHIATAVQLGVLTDDGFEKHPWLPRMNAPVFADDHLGVGTKIVRSTDFVYGTLPGSHLEIGGDFAGAMCSHTAILGVTGSGKTELAFDLLRHVVAQDGKVICIDLTAKYRGRLADLEPRDLSLSADDCADLGAKLFDAETGPYGAGEQKRILKEFASTLRENVSTELAAFLSSATDHVGIITLSEISNTKATLYITELYLTCLLNHARDNPGTCPRTLVVVDEAHTVMPEPSMAGVGDYDSRGLVSKISQIALQGRKYGIGLLVVAQRTATVSKSVLTQCNTVLSFACFDDTSLHFLGNVYGADYTSLLPSLPPLHAVVFGKGVRSQRPLVVQIPFDESKANAAATDGAQHVVEDVVPEADEIPF